MVLVLKVEPPIETMSMLRTPAVVVGSVNVKVAMLGQTSKKRTFDPVNTVALSSLTT